MNRSVILVPVHPPHFHWASGLLDTASPEEEICLGFSNKQDAGSFKHSFPFRGCIADEMHFANTSTYINNKKLNLLKKLQCEYDYIAVVDAETKFIRPTTPHLKEIWDSNCFVANHSMDGARITQKISKYCGYDIKDDLYPWFNSIHIYKTSLLPKFFQWLEERNVGARTDGEAFDFILFAIYCRMELEMPWRILGDNRKSWHGLIEHPHWSNYAELHGQVSWSIYFKGIEKHENIKMLFHLDRYPIE